MKRMIVLFVLLLGVQITFAQEATETPVCTVSIDGSNVDFTGCNLDDINKVFAVIEEQIAGGFTQVKAPQPVLVGKSGNWDVSLFVGSNDQNKQWGIDIGSKELQLAPDVWPVPFNVDNTGYSSANGYKYDMNLSSNTLCAQQAPCPVLVESNFYRAITADGVVPALGWKCSADNAILRGCALVITNIGTVTANFESHFESGFTITGPFYNGGTLVDTDRKAIEPARQALPVAMWAMMSNIVYSMMEKDNCSDGDGCDSVDITWFVVSGNVPVMKIHTVYPPTK
jgi:hypothetical protein